LCGDANAQMIRPRYAANASITAGFQFNPAGIIGSSWMIFLWRDIFHGHENS
jgi:hypothetical protein